MSPSLSQVLAQGAASPAAVNPLFLLTGLAVFFMGVYTSFAVYRRSRLLPAVIDEPASLAETENKEKAEKLDFLVDGLKNERDELAAKVPELNNVIAGLTSALDNARLSRSVLEKSNLALSRNIEKLKAEKETAALKASVPLVKTKIKSLKKAKVEKGGSRKPKRVSRRGK